MLISDDRSDRQPSRFYTADIEVGPDGVGEVELSGTRPFLRPDDTVYPPLEEGAGTTVDPEELRIDPWHGDLWWTSEGERNEATIDPAIRTAGTSGVFREELPLPPNHRMGENTGPRQNEVLESLTFAAGGLLVVSALEGPLIQDGDSPTGGFGNNGVSSVLNTGDPSRLLVMERSFVTGLGNSIRIYEVDVRGATDVKDVHSLRDAPVRPVRKRLPADLAEFDLGVGPVNNVEGMTRGPCLPSGDRSLVLVSDDNFSPRVADPVHRPSGEVIARRGARDGLVRSPSSTSLFVAQR